MAKLLSALFSSGSEKRWGYQPNKGYGALTPPRSLNSDLFYSTQLFPRCDWVGDIYKVAFLMRRNKPVFLGTTQYPAKKSQLPGIYWPIRPMRILKATLFSHFLAPRHRLLHLLGTNSCALHNNNILSGEKLHGKCTTYNSNKKS